MRLSYLKYLRCFCSSHQFTVYALENDRLAAVDPVEMQGSVVHSGVVRCDKCNRCFPIEEGVLDALPDAISDFYCTASQEARCMELNIDCRKNRVRKKAADKTFEAKRSEIQARDEQANVYHTYGYSLYGRNEQKLIRNFLEFSRDDVVIELGSGTGRISQEVIDGGFHDYISVDFSAQSIRLFMEKLDDRTKDRIFFVIGDVCALPLESKIADKIVSAQVFEHIPGKEEQRRFIDELQRLLKTDGLAAMTVYNYNIKKRFDNKISRQGFHNGRIYYENFTSGEMKALISPFFKLRIFKGINCYYPFARRLRARVQELIESILAATPFSAYLGDILFIGLTLRAGTPSGRRPSTAKNNHAAGQTR